jgi:hypothetical protein
MRVKPRYLARQETLDEHRTGSTPVCGDPCQWRQTRYRFPRGGVGSKIAGSPSFRKIAPLRRPIDIALCLSVLVSACGRGIGHLGRLSIHVRTSEARHATRPGPRWRMALAWKQSDRHVFVDRCPREPGLHPDDLHAPEFVVVRLRRLTLSVLEKITHSGFVARCSS